MIFFPFQEQKQAPAPGERERGGENQRDILRYRRSWSFPLQPAAGQLLLPPRLEDWISTGFLPCRLSHPTLTTTTIAVLMHKLVGGFRQFQRFLFFSFFFCLFLVPCVGSHVGFSGHPCSVMWLR